MIDVGGAPAVEVRDEQLVIQWPVPRPEHFLIRSSLFEAMIADVNAGKRLAATLERIRLTIDEIG